ncbi:hypothetical protein FDN13_13020 [Caloramator sp. E03]|uniref:LiaF transmembrane domain-containing protein n=1 Tax=Caloramator sp. E03 TaxID=2576307 RepID=UPI0011104794|nr:hypothetical protein [Caloramator sp. E03]QCX34547.1 hypothetical protein FDN13_13020 [Caloramator sp. E03]
MSRNIAAGIFLITIGIVLIIQRTVGINLWNYIWPFSLIVVGIGIHYKFFHDKNDSNILVIGGILLTYGLLFLFNNITNGAYNSKTNFVYFLGIGIGFIESFIFGDNNKNLIPAIIFISISIYFLLKQVFPQIYSIRIRDYLIPGFLIIFGVYILFKNRRQ